MPYYFMRDTPLQALEQLMMSQPGQKPRGGGIYRSPFRYTPEDVACEYCQNYVRKHPCRLCECTCLEAAPCGYYCTACCGKTSASAECAGRFKRIKENDPFGERMLPHETEL